MELKVVTFTPALKEHNVSIADVNELGGVLAPFRKERELYWPWKDLSGDEVLRLLWTRLAKSGASYTNGR